MAEFLSILYYFVAHTHSCSSHFEYTPG